MKLLRLSILFVLAAAACPAPSTQLWLALNGAETRVQLVPVEPDPF